MLPNEKLLKILFIVLFSAGVMGGCVGPTLSPPYFKDIYESSLKPQAGTEMAGTPGAVDKTAAATTVTKKPTIKIVAIPNPLKMERVTAAAEKKAETPQQKGQAGQPPSIEQQKPVELSVQAATGDVQLSVENMPLYDFVNLALGEILKLNYTVAQDIQSAGEKITLNMSRKMTAKEFFPLVVEMLRKNGLEIRNENGVLFVTRKGQALQTQVSAEAEVYVGNEIPDLPPQKRITLIFSTSYVQAGQILQVVRQLQMLSGDVKAENMQNGQAVALTGTVAALGKIVSLFNQLDRPSFAQRDFNLVYFDYINVMDFDKKLKEVLPAVGIPVAKSHLETGLLTIPFEKINALLVVSQRKEWLEALLSWKEKLDTLESMGDEMQLFVYQPKNRPAEELVEVLRAVATGGNIPTSGGVQPGQTSMKATSVPARPEVGGAVSLPGKNFTAILDKGRNAVIISASPANFKLIRNILMQLDTSPRQILIEATIAEVTLTDQLQFGVEWFIKHNSGDFQGTLSTLGGLALGGAGLNYAVTKLTGDFQAKINMFASKNLINIVSTPHIAVLDGKEASISVGTEVPIVTAEVSAADISGSSSQTGQPSILRSVQYRNTGVILRVKPVINSEGIITIDINQELSEAQNNSTSKIDSPLILNRSIHTILAVKSGETVLLGGLISTNKSNGESKVPILGDIPLIGRFFKTDSTGRTKTELIVQITPYILDNMDQLEMITKKFKESVFLQN